MTSARMICFFFWSLALQWAIKAMPPKRSLLLTRDVPGEVYPGYWGEKRCEKEVHSVFNQIVLGKYITTWVNKANIASSRCRKRLVPNDAFLELNHSTFLSFCLHHVSQMASIFAAKTSYYHVLQEMPETSDTAGRNPFVTWAMKKHIPDRCLVYIDDDILHSYLGICW